MVHVLLTAAVLSLGLATVGTPAPATDGVTAPAADTVVAMRAGDRVVLDVAAGRVTVSAWNRSEMEIRTDGDGSAVTVRRSGSTVRIGTDERKGPRHPVEASIRVPASVDLVVRGSSLDVVVEGVAGRVDVDNVRGDVWISDASGPVTVRTISGEVDVSRARGGVTASSQSDDVRLRDVVGPVEVHSGDGHVRLLDIRSSSVRAETQDGDIEFSGTVADGGEYRFFVHDGDASIAVPAGTNARVAVSTFDGEFESEFPVLLERFTGGREFGFTLGQPRATIEIQVFDGEIRLLRR